MNRKQLEQWLLDFYGIKANIGQINKSIKSNAGRGRQKGKQSYSIKVVLSDYHLDNRDAYIQVNVSRCNVYDQMEFVKKKIEWYMGQNHQGQAL